MNAPSDDAPFGPKLDAMTRGPIRDALRLTRAGRLAEAVAAIKDGLGVLDPARARPDAPARSAARAARKASTSTTGPLPVFGLPTKPKPASSRIDWTAATHARSPGAP